MELEGVIEQLQEFSKNELESFIIDTAKRCADYIEEIFNRYKVNEETVDSEVGKKSSIIALFLYPRMYRDKVNSLGYCPNDSTYDGTVAELLTEILFYGNYSLFEEYLKDILYYFPENELINYIIVLMKVLKKAQINIGRHFIKPSISKNYLDQYITVMVAVMVYFEMDLVDIVNYIQELYDRFDNADSYDSFFKIINAVDTNNEKIAIEELDDEYNSFGEVDEEETIEKIDSDEDKPTDQKLFGHGYEFYKNSEVLFKGNTFVYEGNKYEFEIEEFNGNTNDQVERLYMFFRFEKVKFFDAYYVIPVCKNMEALQLIIGSNDLSNISQNLYSDYEMNFIDEFFNKEIDKLYDEDSQNPFINSKDFEEFLENIEKLPNDDAELTISGYYDDRQEEPINNCNKVTIKQTGEFDGALYILLFKCDECTYDFVKKIIHYDPSSYGCSVAFFKHKNSVYALKVQYF